MKGLLIAGTGSGVGKTTVTLAIIAAMRRRGLTVQPFKGGPDFLDTGHHSRIAARTARNLDTWMLSAESNRDVLYGASRDADAIVVEGMMGLFDGKGGATEAGSSAEIAKLLKLPVVLVIDAGKCARSIAAVVLGFELFDPQLLLSGVILNRVASDRHFRMLETAITSSCRTPILGWLPTEPSIAIPERHLGLRTVEEFDSGDGTMQQVHKLAAMAEEHLDLSALSSLECGLAFPPAQVQHLKTDDLPVRIGVARDRAFSFYYEDNLDLLRQHGAEVVPFSPLDDDSLPKDLDALYLGGGYPELYAERLSCNESMLASIRSFVASERPVYAECGGMIYLSGQLTAIDGAAYAMVGMLPMVIEMTSKLSQFGYVTVEFTQDCLLGPSGTVIRGHSFHYSRLVGAPALATSYNVQYSLSGRQEAEGFIHGNTLASYIHLHFRAAPHVAQNFVERARAVKARELATAWKRLLIVLIWILASVVPSFASHTVTDETGRTVSVPDHPHRVICLVPSITDTVFALGGGDDVVAVSDYVKYPAEAMKKPSVGSISNPSMETIIALHPDLVLGMPHQNQPAILDQLQRFGIPLYIIDPHGIEGILHSVHTLGQAIGRDPQANALVLLLQQRIDAVRARSRGLPVVNVYMPISYDPVITIGKGSFITEIIEAAGGHSITSDIGQEWPHISMEAVIARAPEALLMMRGGTLTVEALEKRPGWNVLPAVKSRRVFYADKRVEFPSPVAIDALEDLAKQFHP